MSAAFLYFGFRVHETLRYELVDVTDGSDPFKVSIFDVDREFFFEGEKQIRRVIAVKPEFLDEVGCERIAPIVDSESLLEDAENPSLDVA